MEPTQNPNQPQQNPEKALAPRPESLGLQQPEQQPAPAAIERAPQAPVDPAQAAPVQIPAVPPAIGAAGAQGATQSAAPAATAGPVQAADVDVIEKEWVDQANRIIEQTKNDPHAEEEAVEALQIDYLKKRYGHSVKKPDEK